MNKRLEPPRPNSSLDDVEEQLRLSLPPTDGPTLPPEVVEGAPERLAPRLVNHGRAARATASLVAGAAVLTIGALVVNSPWQARAPLFTAASATAGGQALGATSQTSDLRIGLWKQYEYLAGEGLESETGRGAAYSLERQGTPDEILSMLAAQFDVTGEVKVASYSSPEFPTTVLGPEDGSAASITVTWAGTGSWWYNNPAASGQWICSSEPDGGEECVEKPAEPVAGGIPSESEARDRALTLFTATGLTVSAEDIRVVSDEWQTVASANLIVDGSATALEWVVAWGSSGAIAWSYGHSVAVVEQGSFDTVSEVDGVARLADGRWFGAPGPEFSSGFGIADSGLAREGAETLPAPVATPEVEVVTVQKAESTLLLVWDSAGDAWLIPGYVYEQPEGWWLAVISLVDGVIALPEPEEVEPLPSVPEN